MPNPVVHFEVLGPDPEALQAFYAKAFGWRMQPIPERPGFAQALPCGFACIDGDIGPASEPRVAFYVEVEDIDATLAEVARAGGRTVAEPAELRSRRGARTALFADPEGHVVGLVTHSGAP